MSAQQYHQSRGDVTKLLQAWSNGNLSALDQLIPLMYPKLRRTAHRCMRGERGGHSLGTSALVNEAYLCLVDAARVEWRDRAHFFTVSAQVMRRILVDFARSRQSQKRVAAPAQFLLDAALDLQVCAAENGSARTML